MKRSPLKENLGQRTVDSVRPGGMPVFEPCDGAGGKVAYKARMEKGNGRLLRVAVRTAFSRRLCVDLWQTFYHPGHGSALFGPQVLSGFAKVCQFAHFLKTAAD